jgi:iron complex transport system substrate-binding protein
MSAAEHRIVSLLPAATEMICGAGLFDRLVGVSHECNWSPEVAALPRLTRSRVDSSVGSAAIDAQVQRLASQGEALYDLDEMLLADLQPTLIVTQSQCDVCAVSHDSVVGAVAATPALERAQILSLNPRTLAEMLADIERIGAAAHAESAAQAFAEKLWERIERVRRQAAGDNRSRPRVVVIEWVEPLMVAGNWTPELAALAGGTYGLAVAGEPSRYATWDALRAFAPEVIMVAPCGFNLQRSQHESAQLDRVAAWRELPAVQRGCITVVDGDAYFNRPGPRLVDRLELLFQAICEFRDGSAVKSP